MSENRQLVLASPNDLLKYLSERKSTIAQSLPGHLNAEGFIRLAVTAFRTNAKLRECTGISIFTSLCVAAQVGLQPGITGQGYLIPYKGTCTFVPGWQGLVGLLNNSGRAVAWTGSVFEGDEWDYQLGSSPKCDHRPGKNFGDPDKLTWVYACGLVNGAGAPVIEAWPINRVWKHRDRFNKVGRQHYSFEHPEMYARKVVLLQVLKYMPRSIELSNAMTASVAAEMGRRAEVQDGVVIDIDGEPILQGTIGSGEGAKPENTETGKTPMEIAAKEEAEKKDTTPAAPKSGEPAPADLLAKLIELGTKINAGKAKIEKTAIALKLMEPSEKLDKLDAKRLAALIDAWDGEGGIADTISTPS